MKIAFVGISRNYRELPPHYVDHFNRYHLELPYYYASDGKNDVSIVTDNFVDHLFFDAESSKFGGALRCISPECYHLQHFDVVIHWRKWFPTFYRPDAINLINCQDHSFSDEWKNNTVSAFKSGALRGILCFPAWHTMRIHEELGWLSCVKTIPGVTLGVDTYTYNPSPEKDPYSLLWASDPGRGLMGAIELAIELWSRDKRFHLNVCYPDYVKNPVTINHPAIKVLGNVSNGPQLWSLFNKSGVLPYTSTFMEPSSRAHRQAMAAGCLVLYPPSMGTPSDLIVDDETGYVRPIDEWADLICETVNSEKYAVLCKQAREYAVSENWSVQAERFNNVMFNEIHGRI